MADKLTDVLTKVYGYVNKLKVDVALEDCETAFKTLNELTEYLVSVDVEEDKPLLPDGKGD